MEKIKTGALEYMDDWTGRIFTDDTGKGLGFGSIRNSEYYKKCAEILKVELGENYSYEDMCNPNVSVSMFEIINWFNNQYRLIREEGKDLPKLEFEVDKWEIGKKEKVSFTLLQELSTGFLQFLENNVDTRNFVYRRLCMSDKSKLIASREEDPDYDAYIETIGNNIYEVERVDIKPEMIKKYLELSYKYSEYIKAYTFLRNVIVTIPEKTALFGSTKGQFYSAIYGDNPFNSLDSFLFNVGTGGNEIYVIVRYDLGKEELEKPFIRIRENDCVQKLSEGVMYVDDLVNNKPHELAKRLRLPIKRLPFKIN